MPQVSPSTSVPKIVTNPVRLSWKNVLLGLFIGTTLIGGSLIAFYYLELKRISSSSQNQQIIIGKPKTGSPSAALAQPRIIADKTVGWETFSGQTNQPNKTIKFSFKHPSDFRVVEIGNKAFVVTNDPDYEVEPASLKTLGKIAASADVNTNTKITSDQVPDFILGGKKAFRLVNSDGVRYFIPSITTTEGAKSAFAFSCEVKSNLYPDGDKKLSESEVKKLLDLCDLIASTFKFLD